MQAIHLLDSNKKGKANFFLLDQLNEKLGSQTPADPLAGAIAAIDIVEYDARYAS